MSLREFTVWLLALTAVLPVAIASTGTAKSPSDPWATLRGCTRVLERMQDCQTDPSFKPVQSRWCDRAAAPTLTEKQLKQHLLSWRRPERRRLSCAIWTGDAAAAEQIGELSPLGRLANTGTCASFNHQLEKTTWLRTKVAESR